VLSVLVSAVHTHPREHADISKLAGSVTHLMLYAYYAYPTEITRCECRSQNHSKRIAAHFFVAEQMLTNT
jgi:hypothetical protein